MAANSIIPPFPSFFEADGSPLENGYIYVGQPGFEAQSSPKASFFDLAMTISTGVSIRTSAGYPVNSGAATMVYVDGDFSITVKDRNGVLVFSSLNRTFAYSTADTVGTPLLAPDGNFANTGFGFINEQNTGLVRQGAGVVQSVILGNVIYQWSATGVQFLLPPSGAGFVTGVAAALDTDLQQISSITAVEGDMLYRNATTWTRLPKGTAAQVLAMNTGATAPEWVTDTAYKCRAFVNFNGNGGATIRRSGGVSGIVRNSTGDYTITFSPALATADYVVAFSATGPSVSADSTRHVVIAGTSDTGPNVKTTTQLRIFHGSTNGSFLFDAAEINVAVFY